MAEQVVTVIYTVSATQARVASFPNLDCVRVGPGRFLPSVKVLLEDGGSTQVVAIPVICQEAKDVDSLEVLRKAMHHKVDEVINRLIKPKGVP